MDNANSTYYTLASVFVAFMIVFGIGLLFVRAARIERNVLVAIATLATTLVAALILRSYTGTSGDFTFGQMLSMMLLSLFGFGLGWIYDRLAGPRSLSSRDEREATLGADLAD